MFHKRGISVIVGLLGVALASSAQPIELVEAFPALNFTRPIYLTHIPDGTDRIAVAQQDGLVRVFPNDSATTDVKTLLNIGAKLSSTGGEEGLLGLAFHPSYNVNGFFYVNYTASGPLRTIIARYSISATNPDSADGESEFRILEIPQPFSNHNGGMIAFGPDGYLYIATGDGGSGNDPGNRAQDRTTILGKILRINVDDTTSSTRYVVPPDNPFVGIAGLRGEIWAYGLRNPFRFSFDPVSGQLWAGDVGQSAREEIDLIVKGGNYGWRLMEGSICNPNFSTCDTSGLGVIPPVKDYPRSLGTTVTGGYIYRGQRRPDMIGAYIYGDYGSGRIWMLRYENGLVTADSQLINTPYSISSFGTDEQGELYIVSHSFTGATKVYRFAGDALTHAPSSEDPIPPGRFRLDQNYPNPFNPTTTITYALSERQFVDLRVHDILGREVVVLANSVQEGGEHVAIFNGTGFPSGIYFYRLTVGTGGEIRPMILIR
ncbi:MAG: PQQ-dependent sugar dehydrogenase [Ignavibacteria bacterium]|nr:PQQ-dependent sugar dehydrogenase [Ignavibacteria bacterium]